MFKNRFYTAIALSILIHMTTTLALYISKMEPPKVQPNLESSTVDLMDEDTLRKLIAAQKTKGQIVEQNKKALNDEVPDKAKFLSAKNQKVLNETKAARTGRFKNTNDLNSGAAKPKPVVAKRPAKPKFPKLGKNIRVQKESPVTLPKLVDLKPKFKYGKDFTQPQERVVQSGGQGPSQTDDYLKDVKTGLQTLLSTREFVYYSYYSRIKNKLRQYWEPMIKERITKILRSGRSIASTSNRVTNLLITLNQKGHLVKVQVMGESGLQDLDEAAIEAFESAAPFPNPPEGIIEQDGTIKIRWDFILEA